MSNKPKVYIASKLSHSDFLKQVILDNPDIYFSCRWPYLTGQVEDTPKNAVNFWISDFDDINNCDYLVLHLEKDDIPRGALVEVGYALAKGKIVLIHGENPYHGTWQYFREVNKERCLEDCLNTIKMHYQFKRNNT